MARRFRFRLETVRRLRQQDLGRQRRVVADAVRAVARVQERNVRVTRWLRNTLDETRDARQAERLDVVSLRSQQFYRGWLHRQLLEAAEELAQKQAELDAQRAKLGEVSKRLKVIEKLRERQWERYQREVNREEQAAYDEAALQRYVRKTTGCGTGFLACLSTGRKVGPTDEVRR